MVKSSHNNGGRGANARLCARDGREKGGEDDARVLYYQVFGLNRLSVLG
jgi:hypothetical protein